MIGSSSRNHQVIIKSLSRISSTEIQFLIRNNLWSIHEVAAQTNSAAARAPEGVDHKTQTTKTKYHETKRGEMNVLNNQDN